MGFMVYTTYMGKAVFEKSLLTLTGIIRGITADVEIRSEEIEELQNWCLLQNQHRNKHPFKEIIQLIVASLEDGILSIEELDDMRWACDSYINKSPYYGVVEHDIQELHGFLHGILSDNKINKEEITELKNWLNQNSHLETVYPYDEAYSLVFKVLEDGKVDETEEKILKAFFFDFIVNSIII
ncbi:hypothetical protein [Paenibacillus herberti]|uniref:Uncharacterized protein n=1 Tax=Paenibacillus herberti TaxID=1619309 RepID=A0A229NZA7_9BACL|nr:hypothetical protein [Paenibacillus herberti]OXM15252.1 hypothetical protein CGZ75_00445 [Paenibacillus herberti]